MGNGSILGSLLFSTYKYLLDTCCKQGASVLASVPDWILNKIDQLVIGYIRRDSIILRSFQLSFSLKNPLVGHTDE